ncbi:hypothetical protein BC831DRAFT_76183, partial [Entophlyctis helioformis]
MLQAASIRQGSDAFKTKTVPMHTTAERASIRAAVRRVGRQLVHARPSREQGCPCRPIKHEHPMLSEFSGLARERFSQLAMASCLLRSEPLLEPDYTGSVSVPILLPFFQSKTSGSLLLSKKERPSLLHRLKGEAIVEFQSVISGPQGQREGQQGSQFDWNDNREWRGHACGWRQRAGCAC